MKKVAILESLGISGEELESFKKPFEGEVEFADYPRTADARTLIEEARDADALIIANMPLLDEVIDACEKLKFIDVAFTGVDHVGLEAAKRKGVKVSNASGYSNEAVAELVIGMALSLLRNRRLGVDRTDRLRRNVLRISGVLYGRVLLNRLLYRLLRDGLLYRLLYRLLRIGRVVGLLRGIRIRSCLRRLIHRLCRDVLRGDRLCARLGSLRL